MAGQRKYLAEDFCHHSPPTINEVNMNFIRKWRIQKLLTKIYLLADDLWYKHGYVKTANDIKEAIQKLRREEHL